MSTVGRKKLKPCLQFGDIFTEMRTLEVVKKTKYSPIGGEEGESFLGPSPRVRLVKM